MAQEGPSLSRKSPALIGKGGAGSSREGGVCAAIVVFGRARLLPIGAGAGMVDFTVEPVLGAALTIEIKLAACARRVRCNI